MKKYILLFVLLGNSLTAQIGFLNTDTIIDNTACVGVVSHTLAEDIDGDGDLDVIYGGSESNMIAWQENLDGLGHFGENKIITSQAINVVALVLVDVDNDGDKDLVSSSSGDGKIAWYRNLGQGNFSNQIVVVSGLTGLGVIAVADITGDNKVDIVARAGGVLVYYKSLSLGSFSFLQNSISNTVAGANSIDIADVDGDGDKDIVANRITSTIYDVSFKVNLYINTTGTGVFATPLTMVDFVTPEDYQPNCKVQFADIDSDNDLDVLYFINENLSWIENNSGFSNLTPHTIFVGPILSPDRFKSIDFADMDNDNDLDMVCAMLGFQNTDRILWFENIPTSGVNNFANSQIILYPLKYDITSCKVVNFDGDGINDLLVTNLSSNYLIWYKNSLTIQPIARYCSYPLGFSFDDIDNDGDLDLFSSPDEGDDRHLVWYENTDGQGTMSKQKVLIMNFENYPNYFFSDIDGDNYKDLVVAGRWYKNDGQGNFNQFISLPSTFGATRNSEADIDNDGIKDFVRFDPGIAITWVRKLDTTGNFSSTNTTILNEYNGSGPFGTIKDIKVLDMDNDGDNDILIASTTKLAYLVNNGQGTFGTVPQEIHDYGCELLHIVDLDGDGKKDILTIKTYVPNSGGDFVAWFKNINNLGLYSNNPIVVTNSSPQVQSVFPIDLDNDGDIDFTCFTPNVGSTSWIENTNGLGSFSNPVQIITYQVPNYSIYATHIDNDGLPDIFYYTNQVGSKRSVSWLKNNGLRLNKIVGTVRYDANDNGCDTADNLVSNMKVVTQKEVNTLATYTSSNGYYQFYLPEDGEYTTSVFSPSSTFYQVSPNQYVHNFTGSNVTQTSNFCIYSDAANFDDLEVIIYPVSEARPGFTSSYLISYRNKGLTQLSGDVTFQYDASKLSYVSSTPTISSQTTGELLFNFANLNPFETKLIRVNFQVFAPPTVAINDLLEFTATINPIASDVLPEDNTYTINQLVIGSYDPNDISVLEGESIYIDETDNYLHYTIRFQNTGTASAIKVVVLNTLDDNLDWDSFQIDGISHNNSVQIRNGNEISFIFNNINLPHSSANQLGSQGYICYRIKPKSNSVVGDIFNNNADIYFDFNPPIHTNTVSTEVINPLSTNDFNQDKFILFPNPTKGIINIVANFEISELTIINMYGQEVLSIEGAKDSVDISSLSKGIYFIKVKNELGVTTVKKVVKN